MMGLDDILLSGLIQEIIALPVKGSDGKKVDRYKQLFISTHNLDFLKYLKELRRPKGGTEQFILMKTKNGSRLELMPRYLRKYITEFHYLFDQICECVDASNINENPHYFFNFGNNLRKFLEIYLFFKFPFCEEKKGIDDYKQRIKRFFEDPVKETAVIHMTNELSHGGERVDRSIRPPDSAEISEVARHVLDKVKEQDEVQFKDLLQAIQRENPLDPSNTSAR